MRIPQKIKKYTHEEKQKVCLKLIKMKQDESGKKIFYTSFFVQGLELKHEDVFNRKLRDSDFTDHEILFIKIKMFWADPHEILYYNKLQKYKKLK